MARSSLTDYVAISPNRYIGRAYPVEKITIHHMAGNLTVEQCGAIFARPSAQASSNYGVGTDARVGCYVDEADAAWTSADYENDNRAVTIEVANDNLSTWSSSSKAYNKTVELVVDICRRNGIKELVYTGDASGNLTEHRMFAATACPGPWWHDRMERFAADVNAKLNGTTDKEDGDLKPVYNPTATYDVFYKDCSKSKLKAARHRFARTESAKKDLVKRGYRNEGHAFDVGGGTLPVYKMYNPSSGDMILTIHYKDAVALQGDGWQYKGVPFFANKKTGAAMYRLYNPSFGQHFYTTDKDYAMRLKKGGWAYEGAVFYVAKGYKSAV